MISVLVTGKDSQLALCIKDLKDNYPSIAFTFKNSLELDITSTASIAKNFKSKTFDYCINCAAYTAVDKAESEPEKAKLANTTGAKNLALACKERDVTLIHISTDFVFDGTKKEPYLETDNTKPISVYGKTKRDGELEIINTLSSNYFIIRTSWLYSQYGRNFVKTILKLAIEKEKISVVNDQYGSPTYAGDLALVLCEIVTSKSFEFGLYHFSNSDVATWFTFAEKISDLWDLKTEIIPIASKEFVTAAERPKFSVLETKKIANSSKLTLKSWQEALTLFCQRNKDQRH